MYWFIAILVIIIFVIVGNNDLNKGKMNDEKLRSDGFSVNMKIDTGKYIAGHPQLDNSIKLTSIFPKGDWLYIFEYPEGQSINMPLHKAGIQMNSINNVLAEDYTSIERKVTVGRMLLVGLFAFAIKKKKINELAYLTIEWKEGRFSHETYFEFEGKDAMQKENKARNSFIKTLS